MKLKLNIFSFKTVGISYSLFGAESVFLVFLKSSLFGVEICFCSRHLQSHLGMLLSTPKHNQNSYNMYCDTWSNLVKLHFMYGTRQLTCEYQELTRRSTQYHRVHSQIGPTFSLLCFSVPSTVMICMRSVLSLQNYLMFLAGHVILHVVRTRAFDLAQVTE